MRRGLPVPEFRGILAIDLGNEVADESLLVESGVVGTEEVKSCAKQAVVIYLEG